MGINNVQLQVTSPQIWGAHNLGLDSTSLHIGCSLLNLQYEYYMECSNNNPRSMFQMQNNIIAKTMRGGSGAERTNEFLS